MINVLKNKVNAFQYDTGYEKRLTRKIDRHHVPLCAFIYLLNYLDRSNIGNDKILNQEAGDSFLRKTHMTTADYSPVFTIFGIAYSGFHVPSNFIMKRHIKPSHWLGFQMPYWGVLTLAFAFVKNSGTFSSEFLRLAFSLVVIMKVSSSPCETLLTGACS